MALRSLETSMPTKTSVECSMACPPAGEDRLGPSEQPSNRQCRASRPARRTYGLTHVSGGAFLEGDLSLLPDGPSAEERDAHRARAIVGVTGAGGRIARSVIETVNGSSFTPLAAIEATRRVLAGEHRPGFQTPVTVFDRASPRASEGR
jgi:hypothetical protein